MPHPRSYSLPWGEVRVLNASLAALGRQFDAIVSSDDNYLSHSGGVSEALWKAAGPIAIGQPTLSLGDVFVSAAGKLPARILLHAVTVDFDANRVITLPQLARLYQDLFQVAAAHSCATLALPLLASGAADISADASARALGQALLGLHEGGTLTDVALAVLAPEFPVACAVLDDALVPAQKDARWRIAGALKDVLPRDGWRLLQQRQAQLTDFRTSLATTLDLVVQFAQDRLVRLHLWDPAAERVRGSIAEARLVRSRLVQGRGTPSEADISLAETSIRRVARALNEPQIARGSADMVRIPWEEPPASDARGPDESDLVRFCEEAAFDVSDETDSEALAVPPLTPTRPQQQPVAAGPLPHGRDHGGTAHVRALHQLILDHLPATSLEKLHELLAGQGFRGAQEFFLLEFLLRRDPIDVLTELFDVFSLRAILERAYGTCPPANAPAKQIAEQLLARLGFEPLRQPRGLRAVRETARATINRVNLAADRAAIRGAVAELATWVEYLCHALLRFVSLVIYEKPPDILLREWGELDRDDSLRTASLGRLLDLIAKVDSRTRKQPPPKLGLFRAGERRLLPDEGMASLPAIRNLMVHFRADAAELSLDELRSKAVAFCEGVDQLVQHLESSEGRIFPRMIVIKGIQYDQWGRRLVLAEDEDGVTETLFTDSVIWPGEMYFMHPLSNPMRIDPILVAAGDLKSPASL
jgi:O-acetyl-ADP-ribose deacetylase (regulator of RNase III)